MVDFWTYFGLELKIMLKKIPLILLGMLAFASVILAIVGTGKLAMNASGNKNFEIIRVGVVGDIDDKYTNIAIQAVKQMKSLKSSFEFDLSYDEEEAQRKLENDEYDMLFVFPMGFVEGFMHGENKDIEVRFSNGDTEVSYYIFSGMADFASTIIVESERNIYTLQDYYRNHSEYTEDEAYDAWLDLNKRFMAEALSRTAAFAQEQITATDELNFEKYYLCNGTILLFLFLGMVCSGMFREKNNVLDAKLSVAGVGYFKRLMSRLFSFIAVFEILYIIYVVLFIGVIMLLTRNAADFGGNSSLVMTLLGGVLAIIPICTFIVFVYELTSKVMGVFTLFVLILVFGLLSGSFYPIWFMPRTIINISDIWLFKIIFNYMKNILLGRSVIIPLLCTGLYVFGMVMVLLFLNRVKRELSHEKI